MIELNNVSFKYDNQHVLKELTLTEAEPVLIGLWGRNGIGKTTLMKLLAGQEKPDQGEVNIFGEPPYNNDTVLRHICYMQEEHPFSAIWSVKDALRFAAYFHPKWDKHTAEQLLVTFNLDKKMKVIKMSKGMRSALQFIIGLSSYADITILDEPTNGLDANMREKMYRALHKSYQEKPRLIILSSHHIEEIQPICESLIVMDNGQIIIHESLESIREQGLWLAGDKSVIDSIVKKEHILDQKEMGSRVKVMLDQPYNESWINKAQENGLSIESTKLQDFLTRKTTGEEREGSYV